MRAVQFLHPKDPENFDRRDLKERHSEIKIEIVASPSTLEMDKDSFMELYAGALSQLINELGSKVSELHKDTPAKKNKGKGAQLTIGAVLIPENSVDGQDITDEMGIK